MIYNITQLNKHHLKKALYLHLIFQIFQNVNNFRTFIRRKKKLKFKSP